MDIRSVPESLRRLELKDVDVITKRDAIAAECRRLGVEPVYNVDRNSAHYGRLVGVRSVS